MEKGITLLLFSTLLITLWPQTLLSQAEEEKSLTLAFEFTLEERSRDSHLQKTEIEICAGVMRYKSSTFISGEGTDVSFEKVLDGAKCDKIVAFLQKNRFDQNITECKSTEDIGLSAHLKMKVSAPFQSQISIIGKKSIWGSDDYIEQNWGKEFVMSKTNIEHVDMITEAERFIALVRTL